MLPECPVRGSVNANELTLNLVLLVKRGRSTTIGTDLIRITEVTTINQG